MTKRGWERIGSLLVQEKKMKINASWSSSTKELGSSALDEDHESKLNLEKLRLRISIASGDQGGVASKS